MTKQQFLSKIRNIVNDALACGVSRDCVQVPIMKVQREYIESLEKRVAELEETAIVWHKYQDEKPEPSHEYEVNIPVIVYSKMLGYTYFADYNINSEYFWSYTTKIMASHWAYLPSLPKGES